MDRDSGGFRTVKTLLQQSQELCSDIDRIANHEKDAQLAQSLNAVVEAVTNHANRAGALAVNFKAMRSGQLTEGPLITRAAVESLRKRIDAVKKRLSERRDNIRQGNTWANFDNEASGLAKNLSANLDAAWRRFIDTQVTDTASLSTFRQVPACKGTLKKVDEVNASLKSKLVSLPTKRGEITEAVAMGREAKDQIGKMKLDGVPKAVELLLKSAATTGIPLSDLSNEVLDWLRDHKEFMAGLRVTASQQ